MAISIVIPTLNAEKNLTNLLKSLWSQRQPPTEIIIVDSSSDDNTRFIAKELHAKVIEIRRNSFDHGGTRNLALRNTQNEIVIFMTQDALPADEYFVENLITPLKREDVPLSYGRQIPRNDANLIEKIIREYNYPEKSMIKDVSMLKTLGIKTFFCSNVCSAVRKKEFEEVGGFPEKIITNEDMVLAAKMILKGYKIAYEASAKVIHSHNYNLREQFQRYFDIGVSISRNRWLITDIRVEKEGRKLLIDSIKYLMKEKSLNLILPLLIQFFIRYLGYHIGLSEKMLPLKLKKLLSMHKYFWDDNVCN